MRQLITKDKFNSKKFIENINTNPEVCLDELARQLSERYFKWQDGDIGINSQTLSIDISATKALNGLILTSYTIKRNKSNKKEMNHDLIEQ